MKITGAVINFTDQGGRPQTLDLTADEAVNLVIQAQQGTRETLHECAALLAGGRRLDPEDTGKLVRVRDSAMVAMRVLRTLAARIAST